MDKKENQSEIKVSLQREDFISFNMMGSGYAFVSFFIYVAVVVTILASSGFYTGLTQEGFIRYIWIPLGLYVFLCGSYYGYIRWRAIRFFEKTEDITAEVTYQILTKGLNVKRGKHHKTLPWEAMVKVAGNQRVLAFFSSKSNAYIVPVESLKAAGNFEDLIATLRTKVPKRRLRIPRGW